MLMTRVQLCDLLNMSFYIIAGIVVCGVAILLDPQLSLSVNAHTESAVLTSHTL